MPRSMLVYQEVPENTAQAATLIGLHGSGGDLDQLVTLGREVGPFQFIAPQAARPVSPATQGYSATSDGYTWYFIQEVGRPEPATFGEGLWLVEQFIYDVNERKPPGQPTFLLGYEQGAVLSTTLAGVVPESLSGVVSICGYLPEIPGWSLPVEHLDGFPVLLVNDPDAPDIPHALRDETVHELSRRGAAVHMLQVAGAQHNPLSAVPVVRDWLESQMTLLPQLADKSGHLA
jgi:predicted esterase